ncbi:MAG: hypothetical protein EOO16_14080 [Chitinophagaceae bacterium]|nr:MAG: hypothetical protein EOO16_14080 [Chitinophagaceae bacterium]
MTPKSLLPLALLALVACSRNNETITSVINPPPAGRLTAFVELDTTRTAPRDTIAKGSISWDAQGRSSLYTYTRWDRNTGDSAFWQQLRYNYGSPSDSLATGFLDRNRIINSGNLSIDREYFLTWNNGRLALDTTTINQYGFSDRFSAGRGNSVYYERRARPLPAPASYPIAAFDFFYQTWNGDDLTLQVDTLHYPTGPSGFQVQNDRTTVSSVYLSGYNPFYDIARPIYRHSLMENFALDFLRSAPRHLVQERTVTLDQWTSFQSPGTVTSTSNVYRYHYVNNAAGQPVRITELVTGATPRHRVLLLQYQ